MSTYYADQLNNVKLSSFDEDKGNDGYIGAQIKVVSSTNDTHTHWMAINEESAQAIVSWLKDKFPKVN